MHKGTLAGNLLICFALPSDGRLMNQEGSVDILHVFHIHNLVFHLIFVEIDFVGNCFIC